MWLLKVYLFLFFYFEKWKETSLWITFEIYVTNQKESNFSTARLN